MESKFMTLLVKQFVIADDDEGVHEPDFPQDFDSATKLLAELREENPGTNYVLYALTDS